MNYFGNKDILRFKKTALLCSQKFPAEVVLKSYDWSKEQREKGNCIVCGNHSQIEKAVIENRLLVVSPFEKETKRVTRETAEIRNKTIIEICDNIIVGYKSKNGQLDNLIKQRE
jgi:hypothetical protein